MPDRNGYIGRAPSDSSVTVARQSYTASGITTDFTSVSYTHLTLPTNSRV